MPFALKKNLVCRIVGIWGGPSVWIGQVRASKPSLAGLSNDLKERQQPDQRQALHLHAVEAVEASPQVLPLGLGIGVPSLPSVLV